MSIVYVDADACPVRGEVEKVAARFNVKTIMVCDGGIRPSYDPMVQLVVVSAGADAADDWIAEHAQTGDIVITQDIPLAARSLEKGALVLSADGKEFTSDNIGMSLSMRELNQHLRETGMGNSFNKSFSAADRSRFLQKLDLLLTRATASSPHKPLLNR